MTYYRQQLLLQQLGIQQWLGKDQPTIKPASKYWGEALWRDQMDHHPVPQQPIVLSNDMHIDAAMPPSIVATHQAAQEITFVEDKPVHQVTAFIATPIPHIKLDVPTIHFHYDVLVHDRFVLFSEIENSVQRQLFQHIQSSCAAVQQQLKWPLTLAFWENSDQFLQSYLQGFFALHSHKIIISLGQIFSEELIAQIPAYEQFGSLQALLEQPQAKKQLWHRLYDLMYNSH